MIETRVTQMERALQGVVEDTKEEKRQEEEEKESGEGHAREEEEGEGEREKVVEEEKERKDKEEKITITAEEEREEETTIPEEGEREEETTIPEGDGEEETTIPEGDGEEETTPPKHVLEKGETLHRYTLSLSLFLSLPPSHFLYSLFRLLFSSLNLEGALNDISLAAGIPALASPFLLFLRVLLVTVTITHPTPLSPLLFSFSFS